MANTDYIHEKVTVAVETLCVADGSFEERLFTAFSPALPVLSSNDAPAELAEELSVLLHLCQKYIIPYAGKMRPIDELDRFRIAEKLVVLLVRSSRMTG